jgi:hypothetical protein
MRGRRCEAFVQVEHLPNEGDDPVAAGDVGGVVGGDREGAGRGEGAGRNDRIPAVPIASCSNRLFLRRQKDTLLIWTVSLVQTLLTF